MTDEPVTLAILDAGDTVIGTAQYDPEHREVWVMILRADGSRTEERVPLPKHGMVQVVRRTVDQSNAKLDIGKVSDADGNGIIRITGTTDPWRMFLRGLKKK